MTSLKEARDKGKLAKFIKEREGEQGDASRLKDAVSSMAGKPGKPVEKPE